MLAGELYLPADPELSAERKRARELVRLYSGSSEDDDRSGTLKQLLGSVGKRVKIHPPFRVDYGYNVHLGNDVYMNYGCVILDCNEVRIGDNVMLAPYVQIYTATHPLAPIVRNQGFEYAFPITIGNSVWIGGGAIILPGVTIGENSVIGAGAVVTKDVPPNVLAAGNPARIIRKILEEA